MVLLTGRIKNDPPYGWGFALLLELEGNLDFRLVLPIIDRCEFDAQLLDFDPVNVIERRLGTVDGIVDGSIKTLGTFADQCDLFMDHCGSPFDVHPQKITRR